MHCTRARTRSQNKPKKAHAEAAQEAVDTAAETANAHGLLPDDIIIHAGQMARFSELLVDIRRKDTGHGGHWTTGDNDLTMADLRQQVGSVLATNLVEIADTRTQFSFQSTHDEQPSQVTR